MDKSEVIKGVAADLHAAEAAIDTAIAQATRLVQEMITARSALSISPVTFSASQSKAMETIATLGAARDAMIECHSEMAKDHRRMGWGTFAIGPLDKYPEGTKPKGVAAEATPLFRVA